MLRYCPAIIICLILVPALTLAQESAIDQDSDGLLDYYETFFKTDPKNPDSDGDGYNDYFEIINQYDPTAIDGIKLALIDSDGDELWDHEEVLWGTDMENPDTDGDGFRDKLELINGYDPNGPGILWKWIRMDLSDQTLSYGQGPKVFNTFSISTGKRGYETPLGEFKILNKVPNAWSRTYGLWMPYWMSFTYQGHGIHELPYWPSGFREGSDHLGTAVSHGCVRLGIGPAEKLYNWAEVGTMVKVVE